MYPLTLTLKEIVFLEEQNFLMANFSLSFISRTVWPHYAWQTTVLSIAESKNSPSENFVLPRIHSFRYKDREIYIPTFAC